MDWLTILLAFIFFVLPVLQQVIEGAKRSRTGDAGEADSPEVDESELEVREPVRRAEMTPASSRVGTAERDSWSQGWTPWPSPSAEPERVEVATRPRREEVAPWTSPPLPVEKVGYKPPVVAPTVPRPVAPITVEAPRRIPVPGALVARPRAGGVAAVPLTRRVRHSGPSVAQQIGRGVDLRRAIILNEVLGPPVSLRSNDLPGPM